MYWEKVTGVLDDADVFEEGPKLCVVLGPNHTEKEWPSLYNQFTNPVHNQRAASANERENTRNEQRPVADWMGDIALRDARIKSLKSLNSQQKV